VLQSNVNKFLPSHYITDSRTFLAALLLAVDQQNEKVEELISEVIDQLFLSTATGIYLMRLGEKNGFNMPPNSGLDITAFRDLVPVMVAAPKQVIDVVNSLLEVFYGSSYVRPSVVAAVPEPYSVADGDDLLFKTESGTAGAAVIGSLVSDLGNVTATELASLINAQQGLVLADTVLNERTGQRFLRLVDRTVGAGSFIQILGGTLQNVIRLPYVVETTQEAGTTFEVSKTATYDTRLRIQWNGVAPNPSLFRAKIGDILTLRGIGDDGAIPLSVLNGTYKILDAGFDYFVVENERFQYLSAFLTLDDAAQLTVTSQRKNVLLDQREFALSSETGQNTVTVTVPAVPPLVRRFTRGSAHLQGIVASVLDLSRTFLKVDTAELGIPTGDNTFVLVNNQTRPEFLRHTYKTVSVSGDPSEAVFTMETVSEEFDVLPFSTPQGIQGAYGEPGSDEFVLTMVNSDRHGLRKDWGFILDGDTPSGNIDLGLLNREHVVTRSLDSHRAAFKILDANGLPVKYGGHPFSGCDVYRYDALQFDKSDFFIQFATALDAQNSGLLPVMVCKFDPAYGTIHDTFTSSILMYRRLEVTRVEGNIVSGRAGFGPGPEGMVIEDAVGGRSHFIGGNITYRFDGSTAHNQEHVFKFLKAVFTGYSRSLNPEHVGSFLYDPDGSQTDFTVGSQIAHLSSAVLQGTNTPVLMVDDLGDFPVTGRMVLNYGRDNAEGPVRFIATIRSDRTLPAPSPRNVARIGRRQRGSKPASNSAPSPR